DLRTGFHLFRAVEPSSNQRREVILHIYSLGEQAAQTAALQDRTDRSELESTSNFIVLGIREVSTGAQSAMKFDVDSNSLRSVNWSRHRISLCLASEKLVLVRRALCLQTRTTTLSTIH